ncbi:ArsR/SmtB family transcription factor [Parvularcula maris]|uniref:Metalloregulator ArsR/SmtB family transcription factor n=1 Tax=Parvularcula maris TaxID=2965077 RepID=A0A9X2RHV5_9PROT|nr:metalloregulator ArsR/SmtB family transcription factor [Parvularcula maris]MCQ8184321.1 metalloregulator ArsR/SmtB family transcription factor [Parvularcula maris]
MDALLKLNPDDFEARAGQAASLLRTMGNPHRLMILCRLGSGEMPVSELGKAFSLSQSALSQHLAVLRREGLVEARREGQTMHYRIGDPAVLAIIETLAAIYCPEMLS